MLFKRQSLVIADRKLIFSHDLPKSIIDIWHILAQIVLLDAVCELSAHRYHVDFGQVHEKDFLLLGRHQRVDVEEAFAVVVPGVAEVGSHHLHLELNHQRLLQLLDLFDHIFVANIRERVEPVK